MSAPDLMTTAEVAKHCGVTPGTVRQWMRDKDLPLEPEKKTGKGWMFSREKVDAREREVDARARGPRPRNDERPTVQRAHVAALLARRSFIERNREVS